METSLDARFMIRFLLHKPGQQKKLQALIQAE